MALVKFSDDETGVTIQLIGATYLFNRSDNQVKFLYELCGKELYKYIQLELNIKKQGISYCPGDVETINKILNNEILLDN